MDAVRIIVSGIVQGVGFRYFVRGKAIELGINGYAVNLSSGDVEIVAEAERLPLTFFIEHVKRGPRHADVQQCDIQNISPSQSMNGFSIR
jgi:acylphosphatase